MKIQINITGNYLKPGQNIEVMPLTSGDIVEFGDEYGAWLVANGYGVEPAEIDDGLKVVEIPAEPIKPVNRAIVEPVGANVAAKRGRKTKGK